MPKSQPGGIPVFSAICAAKQAHHSAAISARLGVRDGFGKSSSRGLGGLGGCKAAESGQLRVRGYGRTWSISGHGMSLCTNQHASVYHMIRRMHAETTVHKTSKLPRLAKTFPRIRKAWQCVDARVDGRRCAPAARVVVQPDFCPVPCPAAVVGRHPHAALCAVRLRRAALRNHDQPSIVRVRLLASRVSAFGCIASQGSKAALTVVRVKHQSSQINDGQNATADQTITAIAIASEGVAVSP